MLRLSMRPTGWFQIGWSNEIPVGGITPLRYFGQDLVAFRTAPSNGDRDGPLHVLDAHCRHMGAHLGYDSRIVGDCIACPYHGWEWDGEGVNTRVPYQDQPTRATMRTWPVAERNGLVYLWHDPTGNGPRDGWTYPDLFNDFPHLPADEADFFPCHPAAVIDKPDEAVHPQLMLENSADCTHFAYAHRAPEHPRMLRFDASGTRWRTTLGFVSPKTKEVAMQLHHSCTAIGTTAAVFEGPSAGYRLILTATPVDDERSHLRVSYFLPRNGVEGDELPPDLAAFARHTEDLFEEDARIWRHQAFVQKPIYALDDRAAYRALRTWCEQFYESDRAQRSITVIEES